MQFGQTGFVYFIWYDADLLTLTVRNFYMNKETTLALSLFNWDRSTYQRRYTNAWRRETETTQREDCDYLCGLARNPRYSWWYDGEYMSLDTSYIICLAGYDIYITDVSGGFPLKFYHCCKHKMNYKIWKIWKHLKGLIKFNNTISANIRINVFFNVCYFRRFCKEMGFVNFY